MVDELCYFDLGQVGLKMACDSNANGFVLFQFIGLCLFPFFCFLRKTNESVGGLVFADSNFMCLIYLGFNLLLRFVLCSSENQV